MNTVLPESLRAARQGKTLVFTNGVFDVLHAGHVDYLEKARALGDLLVVGLNTDASVRRLGKGPGRPVNPLEDRARVVGALRCVDAVLSFDEDDPCALIEKLRPDVHVKGGDYRPEDMPETAVVEGYGGRVVILDLLPGRSTTALLTKLSDSRRSED
ncbi:MAG: D-glycero-beta-D-manno-heptose 1-phosphate adenylyltransferase [Armatimonadetes bacterium]|nr:D-glycero-beta-D-manno-heptose 1-phosphate adenylyltransferase [Armatimonadota bacterium]